MGRLLWGRRCEDTGGESRRDDKDFRRFRPLPARRRSARSGRAHDSVDDLDLGTAEHVRFPDLKPSTKPISLPLPVALPERIKVEANKRDAPYPSLIKVGLKEKVGEEQRAEHLHIDTATRASPLPQGERGGALTLRCSRPWHEGGSGAGACGWGRRWQPGEVRFGHIL